MNDLPIFMRPIQIDSTNDDVTIGGVAITLDQAVYANIAHLVYHIDAEVVADGGPAGFNCTLDSTFHVVLSATGTFAVTWTSTDLRDLLGFTGNLSSANTYTATHTPENTWIPSRSRADEREWALEHKNQWRGNQSRSGYVCGLRTGDYVYGTEIDFEALGSSEVLIGRSTSAYGAKRTLEWFASNSRETWATENTPALNGFYFVPDRTTISPAAAATWTSGSVATMSYSSGAATFAWCQFDAEWYPTPRQTLPVRNDYTDVSLSIHTATAPTWTGA